AKFRRVAQSTVKRFGKNGGSPLVTQAVCAAPICGNAASENAPADARKARLFKLFMRDPQSPLPIVEPNFGVTLSQRPWKKLTNTTNELAKWNHTLSHRIRS